MRTRFSRTAKRALAVVPIALSAAMMLAASPASASTPTPAITKWSARPTTLSDAGGTVTFNGIFKFAATCTLSVAPRVKGLPSKSSCSSDKYTKKVVLPKNTSGTAATYTFAFAVTNKTGTTDATNIVVGVGAAPPPISMTPKTFGFGSQGVGILGVPKSVAVTNNAKVAQSINGIGLAPGPDPTDFSVTDGNCLVFLGPAQSCDFQVTFNPQSGGPRSETVLVNDASWGATGAAASLPVNGVGQFATASVSDTDVQFAAQGVDTASNFTTVTISNSGSVPLHLQSFAINGSDAQDFGFFGNTCVGTPNGNILSIGKACTFEVQFTPSDSGTRESTLDIGDNTPKATTAVTLTGTGDWTTSQLSLYTINFQPSPVGTDPAEDKMVTITNLSSTVSLTFLGAAITGTNSEDFQFQPNPLINGIQEDCAQTHFELGPNESCQFEVIFSPLNVGTRTGQLIVFDNSNNATNPQAEVVSLTGTGQPPA